jgi:hypothetical protein
MISSIVKLIYDVHTVRRSLVVRASVEAKPLRYLQEIVNIPVELAGCLCANRKSRHDGMIVRSIIETGPIKDIIISLDDLFGLLLVEVVSVHEFASCDVLMTDDILDCGGTFPDRCHLTTPSVRVLLCVDT